MSKKTTGTVFFAVASLLLWGLAAYLGLRAGESAERRVFALAAAFAALVLSAHTVLYALFADRKAREHDWLRAHGRPVDAEIVKVGRRGRRSAWRIKARWLDHATGQETVFKSEILRASPRARFRPGDRIRVYLHPTEPRRYWMDAGIDGEYL